jgi:8-oxo-dGTP pyrophosphatase MutT (NUDIX family)
MVVTVVAEAGPREVARFSLDHGADPATELARLGWVARRVTAADAVAEGLELRFTVEAATPTVRVTRAVPTDPGLVLEDEEEPEPYQRAAAYGVVTSDRGVLLTELSDRTSSPGRWTLPGGGLDPGESPVAALHREVWEESGQQVEEVRLLDVLTSHWIGRAPSGRLEDFHAVRIVYAAWCPQPTDPVVHDVGGSTESVRWVPRRQLGGWPLSRSFAPHLARWLDPPGRVHTTR